MPFAPPSSTLSTKAKREAEVFAPTVREVIVLVLEATGYD